MNNIAAHMIANLTSSVRFEGELNVDLNEITTNLVPYPQLQFVVPSLSPLYSLTDMKLRFGVRSVDQMFSDAVSPLNQLVSVDVRASICLASALLVRGDVSLADATRNIERLRSSLKMPRWNTDGFKLGLCGQAPVNQRQALLMLCNTCEVRHSMTAVMQRFDALYRRRAHLHHYTEFISPDHVAEARESIRDLVTQYETLNRDAASHEELARRLIPVL